MLHIVDGKFVVGTLRESSIGLHQAKWDWPLARWVHLSGAEAA
jgi:hypothetical protein